jgi:hypothetical protein
LLSAPSQARSLEFGFSVSNKLVNTYDGSIVTGIEIVKGIKFTAALPKYATRNVYKPDGDFRELIGTILQPKGRSSL